MTRIVSYIEPMPGLTKNGTKTTCMRTIQMSEHDVCSRMRYTISQGPMGKDLKRILHNLTNKDLINEFVAVHWAEIIEQEERPRHDLSNR